MLHKASEHLDSLILMVDDADANLLFLRKALESAGYTNLHEAKNGEEAIDFCRERQPDLVLLDLHMPRLDGFQALELLRNEREDFFPILVFTADTTSEAKRRALNSGATDFLTKPGDLLEICLRVKNFLQLRFLYQNEHTQREELERRVQERTRELQEAHVEILARLAMTAEYRDDDTGEHTKRVSDMSGRLATHLGLPQDEVSLIRYGALLHDLGKVAIPDSILLKHGPLSPEEMDVIRKHPEIGGRLLANSKSPLLQKAQEIALTHHERWDGTGYPAGLSGEAIPLAGRVVSVADVYDALTSERVYKKAFSARDALSEIVRCSGTQFDPKVVSALLTLISDELLDSRAA